ncbi:MAG: GGDEF domain-containing protein [Planctomycetes bacterium]|nr:GGDEF domain-containing protein [Planctomycetota bacterium]
MPIRSDSDFRKILLIGDISRAFLDAEAVRELPCEVFTNMPDAIEAASKNSFAAVAIVMSGLSSKLSLVLKALREINAGLKIVLLAQMWEEPVAIQLVGSTGNHAGAADDYLICPIRARRLCEFIMSPQGKSATGGPGTARDAAVDAMIEKKIRHLEKLATEDDLTGLKNRRYIREFSRQIIERAMKENGRVTLLVFDIDNFKHYNDVYGHSAGDEILRQAAVLMQRCCRSHDVVGRIGGDEFAVVFWDEPQAESAGMTAGGGERRSAMAQHPKEAIFIAKRFQKELGKAELHLLGPEGKGVLTISGGLASLGNGCSTSQELFEQTDKALLEAKRSGKNRIYLVGGPEGDIADVE